MILIFDLDDTLYPERSYVLSGLRAVAEHGYAQFGLPSNDSYRFMVNVLDREGRGQIFDKWLDQYNLHNRKSVNQCVKCYRHHQPDISLDSVADKILSEYRHFPLYLVTDGHKIVQHLKVRSLGLESRFKRIFITHRFGRKCAKPSTYCFERIKKLESCDWDQMMYVGDNPAKDFVNIKPLGVKTVRVLTGEHIEADYGEAHEASVVIPDLSFLPNEINNVTL
jgi:putative hydrolase of the HAD superfamily